MKELTTEQKAKAYDKAIKKAESLYKVAEPMSGCNVIIETLFPSFKKIEDKDKRIIKALIQLVRDYPSMDFFIKYNIHLYEITNWLEQREQETNDDEDILQRFSFYSYKDEPNILYLSGLYVNSEHRNKGIGTKILKIVDEVAASMKCNSILLKTEIDSNAERLYKNNGYSVFRKEGNQVWLKKQGNITKLNVEEYNKFAKSVLSNCAMSFINYLDAHKYEGKMCVSNGECEDIENAFRNAMWDRLHRYYCKYIEKQGEQKPDKVEPKFKNGQWIVWQNKCYKVNDNDCGYELIDQSGLSTSLEYGTIDESARLWDITKDAKDCDVLHASNFSFDCIFIFDRLDNWEFDEPNGERAIATGHCCLTLSADNMEFCIQGPDCIEVDTVKPATNIQRTLLEKVMSDAGYTFDFEKKELKKIEQKPDNVEYEQEINYPDNLPKDNWELIQEFVNKFGRMPKDEDELNALVEYVLKRQKSWSEEDELMLNNVIDTLKPLGETTHSGYAINSMIDFLKSLKERVQPKQEWSKEDEKMFNSIVVHLNATCGGFPEDEKWANKFLDWFKHLKNRVQNLTVTDEELIQAKKDAYNDALDKIEYNSGEPTFDDGWSAAIDYIRKKSLRPQPTWKPSLAQLNALSIVSKGNAPDDIEAIVSLYNDLKKLKE